MSDVIWDTESVVEAIQRAGATWSALPPDRGPAKLKAAWPETFTEVPHPDDFEARRHIDATRYIRGEDGRPLIALDGETKQTGWAKGFDRPVPPTAAEISHADHVADWNKYLGGRTDLVDAVWLCHGAGFSLGDAARIIAKRRQMKHPYSKDALASMRNTAVALICRGLNRGSLPRRPPDFGEGALDPARFEEMRQALLFAFDALDPLVAALAHADPVGTKTTAVPARTLYKAAQAQAKILSVLKTKPSEEN